VMENSVTQIANNFITRHKTRFMAGYEVICYLGHTVLHHNKASDLPCNKHIVRVHAPMHKKNRLDTVTTSLVC